LENLSRNARAITAVIHLFIDTNAYLNFYHFSEDALEELNKLSVAIRSKEILLYIPMQVVDEFNRNRENKISDALSKFRNQPIPDQFPNITKTYDEYKEMRSHLEAVRKTRASLLEKIRIEIDARELAADRIIESVFTAGKSIKTDDDIVEEAVKRANRGNPPGKNGSLGDGINWLTLLNSVPKKTDLYLVTEDEDFVSKLDGNRLCEFLRREWISEKESNVYLYRKLTDFFRDKYPEIKLASELEKQLAIDALVTSPNFKSTHAAIKDLTKHSDFTDTELNEIVQAMVSNKQISMIFEDEDVKTFSEQILRGREGVIDPVLYQEFSTIYSYINPDDIPF